MAVRPAQGEVIEQTIRTRSVPDKPNGEGKDEHHPPIWEFVEILKPADWETGEYEFTIYRGKKEQKAEDKVWIGKFAEKITPEIIQRRWGGGDYNVWMKVPPGRQLRYNVNLRIEGDPHPETMRAGLPGIAGSQDSLVQALLFQQAELIKELRESRGGDLARDAVRSAVALNGEVFRTGLDTVRGAIGTAQPPANPMIDIQTEFMRAAITRMLAPPSNAVTEMLGVINALKGANLLGGESKTDMAVEIVRRVPDVTRNIVQGLEAWRGAEEARARSAAIMRTGVPVGPAPGANGGAQPGSIAPIQIEMPAAAATSAAGTEAQPAQVVVMKPWDMLDQMLVNVLKDETLSMEQAVSQCTCIMDRFMPGLVEQLVFSGEEGILRLFTTERPLLKQILAPAGPWTEDRLREFIRLFVAMNKEAPTIQPPNPQAPPA
jgi:hypothetical protein